MAFNTQKVLSIILKSLLKDLIRLSLFTIEHQVTLGHLDIIDASFHQGSKNFFNISFHPPFLSKPLALHRITKVITINTYRFSDEEQAPSREITAVQDMLHIFLIETTEGTLHLRTNVDIIKIFKCIDSSME